MLRQIAKFGSIDLQRSFDNHSSQLICKGHLIITLLKNSNVDYGNEKSWKYYV